MHFTRIHFSLFVGLTAGVGLAACFTPQPLPECSVSVAQSDSAPHNGVAQYAALLTPVTVGTSCPDLKLLKVGMEAYPPLDGGTRTIAFRVSRLIDIANGYVTQASTDATNDCTEGTGCEACVAPPGSAGDNVCQEVMDNVPRVDPADLKGEKLTETAGIDHFPGADGLCLVKDNGVKEDFQAESVTLLDGGTVALPALPVTLNWTNFKVVMTAAVPGTAWTADLAYSEGACRASYKVVAFWPTANCTSDNDCATSENYDAGILYASGINPLFKPVCNTDLGVCVLGPDVDVTKLK